MNLLLRKKDNLESLNDQLFANFLANPVAGYSNFMKSDIIEKEKGYEFSIEIPGAKKEDIKISLDEGNLEISVTIKKETTEEESKYIHRERFYGTSTRTYYVGEYIKNEDIKASFNDGILKLFVPKKEIVKEEKTFINIE